ALAGAGVHLLVLDVGPAQVLPVVQLLLPRPGVLVVVRHKVVVVLGVHRDAQSQLLHVGQAGRRASLFTRLGKDGEENGGQDGNNRYHDQQLDQGKGGDTKPLQHRTISSPEHGSQAELQVPGEVLHQREVRWRKVELLLRRWATWGKP